MDKEFFTTQLGIFYSKQYSDIVKKKHGKTPEITFGYICDLIYTFSTLTEVCKELDISAKTLRNVLASTFPELAGNKGTVWRVELLAKINYRKCNQCKKDKVISEFYNSISSKEGKSWHCKDCAKNLNKLQRELKPEIIKASNRKRKAVLKGAFDSEADLDLIKSIYKNCPEGYHVDHIIPISKGGLHHENNLCYLPASLNLQKHTKLPEEVPDIMKFAIYPNKC